MHVYILVYLLSFLLSQKEREKKKEEKKKDKESDKVERQKVKIIKICQLHKIDIFYMFIVVLIVQL